MNIAFTLPRSLAQPSMIMLSWVGWGFLLRGLLLTSRRGPLGRDALLSSLAGGLCLGALGVHLFLEDALALFLGLGFVDLTVGEVVSICCVGWVVGYGG